MSLEVRPGERISIVGETDDLKKEIEVLIEAYHSEEVRAFAQQTFHGAVVPAW